MNNQVRSKKRLIELAKTSFGDLGKSNFSDGLKKNAKKRIENTGVISSLVSP